MIKIIKTTGAALLLGLGAILLAAGFYAPFDSENKPEERTETLIACLVFGVPLTAAGGWLVWGLSRDKQQATQDHLQATFAKLLKQNQGRITVLDFALESKLSGQLAKAYLDERSKEFNANFDVDDEGGITYRFHSISVTSESNFSDFSNLPASPASHSVSEFSTVDLILESVPIAQKIAAIKVVRELTDLGLKEAKDLVESTPCPFPLNRSKASAQFAAQQLRAIGASVTTTNRQH